MSTNNMLSCCVQVPGLVNVDFADVRAIMMGAGSSLMGQGRASGRTRAKDAALAAISSPLLDVGIERATGIVWNITGPPDLTLFEVLCLAFHNKILKAICYPSTFPPPPFPGRFSQPKARHRESHQPLDLPRQAKQEALPDAWLFHLLFLQP